MFFLTLAPVLVQSPSVELATDPSFKALKSLVGGTWQGVVGKNIKVRFRFTIEHGGTLIVGNGQLNADSKNPIPVRSCIGWDPEAKKPFYLDQHGSDTVYFGHVSMFDSKLVFDFNGLVGDKGHYIAYETISEDDYTSAMSSEKNGVMQDLGFHLHLRRTNRK